MAGSPGHRAGAPCCSLLSGEPCSPRALALRPGCGVLSKSNSQSGFHLLGCQREKTGRRPSVFPGPCVGLRAGGCVQHGGGRLVVGMCSAKCNLSVYLGGCVGRLAA